MHRATVQSLPGQTVCVWAWHVFNLSTCSNNYQIESFLLRDLCEIFIFERFRCHVFFVALSIVQQIFRWVNCCCSVLPLGWLIFIDFSNYARYTNGRIHVNTVYVLYTVASAHTTPLRALYISYTHLFIRRYISIVQFRIQLCSPLLGISYSPSIRQCACIYVECALRYINTQII